MELIYNGRSFTYTAAPRHTVTHLRVAWVNQRFDELFSNHPLSPTFYSPNQ